MTNAYKKSLNYIKRYLTSQSSKACISSLISCLISSLISYLISVLISERIEVVISNNWEKKKSRSSGAEA